MGQRPQRSPSLWGSIWVQFNLYIYRERDSERESERAPFNGSVRVTILKGFRSLGFKGFRGFRAWGIRFQTVVSETTTSVKGVRF